MGTKDDNMITMKMYVLLSILLVCGAVVYTNEFVKKTPARIQRKQAQQWDKLLEKCVTLLDNAITCSMTCMQHDTAVVYDWYTLLRSLATNDASCLDNASLESLKEYVASLEEVMALQQKYQQALTLCQEKQKALSQTSCL